MVHEKPEEDGTIIVTTSGAPASFSTNGYSNLRQGLIDAGVDSSLIKPGDIGPKEMDKRQTPTNASIIVN